MIVLSLIQNAKDTCPSKVTLDKIVDMIQSSNWALGYEPILMVQGVFEGNVRQQDLISLSGLSMALFSHVDISRLAELRKEARDDPHTLLMFTVADCLIILYPYELDIGFEIRLQRQFYQKAFLYGNDYYEQLLGLQAERRGRDAGKRCPLAHDANVYYNPMADPFLVWEIKEGCKRQSSKSKSTEGLRERKPNYQERYMTMEEMEQWLNDHLELRHNTITRRTEYRWFDNNSITGMGPWQNFEDSTLNTLYRRMKKEKEVKRDEIDWLVGSDFVVDFNPFKAYLDSLPSYDGGDYILSTASGVTVAGDFDDWQFFVECFRKWFVAMIAGWLHPTEVNHQVLVFIGRQGIYKTTWMNHLLPPELRNYFCTQTGIGHTDRDTQLAMSQYGLICCEELDTMSTREMNEMKRAVTLSHIDARPAYGRYTEHRKHIASFCGTGNNEKFLNDPTGTRRWMAFKVESIVSPRVLPFEYEGLYAQAYYLYRNGFEYWVDGDGATKIDVHNNCFKVANLEQQMVYRYFRRPAEGDMGEFVDVGTAIQFMPGSIAQKLRKEAVDQAFISLGFESIVIDGMAGYRAVHRMPEEINALGRQMMVKANRDEKNNEPF